MPVRDVQSNAQNIATETTAATLAKETGGNLDTIAGATSSTDTKMPADPAREGGNLATVATALTVGPVPISAAALPLPAGAATEATVAGLLTDTELRASPVDVQELIHDIDIVTSGTFRGTPAVYLTIFGRRSQGWVNTSALGDICDYLDTSQSSINTPTVGQTLYIVSTNANDTAGGTGVRTVRFVYLDNNGDQQVGSATMNGATPVSLGAGYTFIQWVESATVGSGGAAAGVISISSTNGAATVATTFDQIRQGGNRSLSARYQVPTGKTGYLIHWSGGSVSSSMDMRLRADVFTDDRSLSAGVFHFQDTSYCGSGTTGSTFADKYLNRLKCPAGAVIKLSAIPSAAGAGNRADGSFAMLVLG